MPAAEACGLLDNWGLYVQGLLGLIAFSTLVIKRYREVPQRPLKVWFFDTSKQGFANIIIHFVNVFASTWMSGVTSDKDPCTWYIMSIIVDSTLGLGLLILFIKWTTAYIRHHRMKLLYSGDYGRPPQAKAWAAQALLYLFLVAVNKIIIFFIMQAPFWQQIGEGIRKTLQGLGKKTEAVFTMLLLPFIITACWFWVIDNYIMKIETTDRDVSPFDSVHMRDLKAHNSDGEDGTLSANHSAHLLGLSEAHDESDLVILGDDNDDDHSVHARLLPHA